MGGGFIHKVDEEAWFEGNHTNGTESDPDCAAPLVKMHIHAAPFLIGAGGTPGSGDSCVDCLDCHSSPESHAGWISKLRIVSTDAARALGRIEDGQIFGETWRVHPGRKFRCRRFNA